MILRRLAQSGGMSTETMVSSESPVDSQLVYIIAGSIVGTTVFYIFISIVILTCLWKKNKSRYSYRMKQKERTYIHTSYTKHPDVILKPQRMGNDRSIISIITPPAQYKVHFADDLIARDYNQYSNGIQRERNTSGPFPYTEVIVQPSRHQNLPTKVSFPT